MPNFKIVSGCSNSLLKKPFVISNWYRMQLSETALRFGTKIIQFAFQIALLSKTIAKKWSVNFVNRFG